MEINTASGGAYSGKISSKTRCEKRQKSSEKPYTGAVILWFFSLFFAFYLLVYPKVSAAVVADTLKFFSSTLIPSLFPFIVVSELLVSSGFGSVLGRYCGRFFVKLFGVSENGVIAYILGMVSGYPLGAKTAVSLYTGGDLNKKDAEFLLGICNNGSPAFLIAGIGAVMWESVSFGVILYLTQVVSVTLCGVIFSRKNRTRVASSAKKLTVFTKSQTIDSDQNEQANTPADPESQSAAKLLSNAIANAALTMVKICGFVLFFEILIGGILNVAFFIGEGSFFSAIIASFFELSSGIEIAITHADATKLLFSTRNFCISYRDISKILTFGSVGWAGVCVHVQVASFASSKGLSMRSYFKTKAMQSLLCALIAFLFVIIGII